MSYTNTDIVEVREANGQKGLFARQDIAENTLLGCFDGNAHLVNLEVDAGKGSCTELFWQQSIHLDRIGSSILCLIPAGELSGVDFLNHSCRGNANVVDKLRVYSKRHIQRDEEITADYRSFDIVPRGIQCWCDVSNPCVF